MKMKKVYYLDAAENVQGPVSRRDLETLLRSGQITSTTRVCEEGEEYWSPYEQYSQGEASASSKENYFSDTILPGKSRVPPEPTFNGITKAQGNVLIILLLIGIGAPFFSMLKPIQKWEYLIVAPSDSFFESSMDSYGNQGWELVVARRATGESGASYECILKRQKK